MVPVAQKKGWFRSAQDRRVTSRTLAINRHEYHCRRLLRCRKRGGTYFSVSIGANYIRVLSIEFWFAESEDIVR